jgi:acetyl esterase
VLNQLEPGIRELVSGFIEDGCPCPAEQSIEERRKGYSASTVLAGTSPEMFEEYQDTLQGITLKIFKPNAGKSLPITVYFHGGCFISGGFDTHHHQLRQLAKLSNTLVICIKYRLAPENKYPAAHDDVYQAVQLIHQHGHKYDGDTANINFVGDSAGGQLALVTTLRLKAESNWLPNKQILIYPMLDSFGSSESYLENGKQFIITSRMLLSGFEMYIDKTGIDKAHPEISPLFRDDFAGLPITYLITAEFDPLRDEGEALYKKLLAHGVEVYCERYLGVIHGFLQLSGVSKSAARCLKNLANQLSN